MGKTLTLLHKDITTEEQFCDTYESKRHIKSGLLTLKEHNIFPLNILNPNTKALNTLGLYSYFSGNLSVGYKIRANGRISSSQNLFNTFELYKNLWEKELGLNLKKQKSYYSFGVNGGTYARLLNSMGFYASSSPNPTRHVKKASVGTTLPKYLQNIIENYDENDIIMRKFFKPHLKDLVDILIETKASNIKPSSLRVTILSQPPQEELIREGKLIAKIIGIVYPEIKINTDKNLKTGVLISKDREVHFGNIYFPQEQIEHLHEVNSPILNQLFPNNKSKY